jgi:hypothetical protein
MTKQIVKNLAPHMKTSDYGKMDENIFFIQQSDLRIKINIEQDFFHLTE